MSDTDLRVLIIGKTGNGKSSLGNTLLGRTDAFKTENSFYSVTAKCQWELGKFDGRAIEVTDTPGLCDSHRKKEDVYIEIAKSVALANPGPHGILFVLKASTRFTEAELNAFEALKMMFSGHLSKYLIIVFTEIDTLVKSRGTVPLAKQRERLRQQVEDPLAEESGLKRILDEAGHRYIGISNTASDAFRVEQRRELVRMIEELKRSNNNDFFTSDLANEIKQNLETLVAEIIAREGSKFPEASIEAKRRIQAEFPDPGFWEKITTPVARYFRRITNKACSVM